MRERFNRFGLKVMQVTIHRLVTPPVYDIVSDQLIFAARRLTSLGRGVIIGAHAWTAVTRLPNVRCRDASYGVMD
jgi:hypothetical protein